MYIGCDASVQFRLANESETFVAYRNGVDVTNSFIKQTTSTFTYYLFHSLDDSMHKPAQWVIVTESELARFDMNNDGKVDISDVTKLVNEILGQSPN